MPTIYTEDPVGKAVEDHYWGTQGVPTGSVANSIGFAQYQDAQRAQQFASAGPRGSSSGSPELGMAFLILVAAAGTGMYWNSWIVGGSVLVGLFAAIMGLYKFFQTALGEKALFGLGVLLMVAMAAAGAWVVYTVWGMTGIAWAVGLLLAGAAIIGVLYGLKLLAIWFFDTSFGRGLVRVVRITATVVLVGGLGAGALYLAKLMFI